MHELRRRKSDTHILTTQEDSFQKCFSAESYRTSRRRSLPKHLPINEPFDASSDEKQDGSAEETLAIQHDHDVPAPEVAV